MINSLWNSSAWLTVVASTLGVILILAFIFIHGKRLRGLVEEKKPLYKDPQLRKFLIYITVLTAIAGFASLKAGRIPDIYRVRVTVLTPQGPIIEDARVWSS